MLRLAVADAAVESVVLIELLMTVLTAVLRLVVEDMAPLRLLLIWDRDTDCPLSTELTAVLSEVVEDIAPLRELLICDRDVL